MQSWHFLDIRASLAQVVECAIEIGERCQSWAWEVGKRMESEAIDVFAYLEDEEPQEKLGQH